MSPANSLKINEIFYSIQGESSWAGYPTVFVRTSGCPLRCTYCDTTYAYNEGEMMDIDSIVETIASHGTPYVCLTGGEPLIQKNSFDLMKVLCDKGYKVSVETSGAVDCTPVDERVKKIIDVKTPDSGAFQSFNKNNLKFANVNTEYKFVICSEKDFDWAEDFSARNNLFETSNVLYSPSYEKFSEKILAKKILSKNSSARLQLQLHKYIWLPTDRGV